MVVVEPTIEVGDDVVEGLHHFIVSNTNTTVPDKGGNRLPMRLLPIPPHTGGDRYLCQWAWDGCLFIRSGSVAGTCSGGPREGSYDRTVISCGGTQERLQSYHVCVCLCASLY